MDCLGSFEKAAEGVIDFVCKHGIRQVTYIIHYKQIVDELNDNVKDLRLEKERINHQCDEVKKNLHNIEGKITQWIHKVSEFETVVKEFENDEGHKRARKPNCYIFPYLWNRHRLGRQAKKIEMDVKKLIDESLKFNEVSYRQYVTSNDATLSNAGFVEFGSTKSIMEKIIKKLEDSTVRMIGLYGSGGVGKSTLIKEIARRVKDKQLFDVVVKVDITAKPNPQKIQEEIAYALGLRLEGEGENVRADYLRRRLKKEKGNTLLILDDLWDKLDLNKLGIPLDDDDDLNNDDKDLNRKVLKNDDDDSRNGNQDFNHKVWKKEKILHNHKGFKILLTSRDRKVLYDKMDVKLTFCLKELDEKDSMMLFQKVARTPNELSDSKQEIVKKYCAGLPMAIVTVAMTLRNKNWEATLEKLKKQELVGVQTSMDISVKMSYEHLESEEIKSIFLLCAQMGHQALTLDLVKYCFGLSILEGVYSLSEAQERIHTSIQKLKDSGLVLDGYSNTHFNMHDMVRDAALSIARKDQEVFILRNGKLDDWSKLERCTSISICNSDIIDKLPEVLNCSQLNFFQIKNNDQNLIIPTNFFQRMENLRVLILTGFCLSSLPSSLKCLLKLKMLYLEQCTLKDNLSIVGKLKKLRILSLSGSKLKNLPTELGCLHKLQLLDISDCSIQELVSPDLISRLACLEELYIRNSFNKTLVEGNKSQNLLLSELKNLPELKVVDLSIPCVSFFPNHLFFDKLKDYKIVIGDLEMLSDGDLETFRFLALQLKDDTDIHSHKGIKLMFKRVENLLLGKVDGVENVVYELNIDGFPYLKHFSIINNNNIKYVNSTELSNCENVFPNLESLCLYNLENLEMICYGPVTNALFPNLETIKVKNCYGLKNLFSFCMVKCDTSAEACEIDECNSYMDKVLASLETMEVSDCKSLKEILQISGEYCKVEFLKLHTLTLQSLPSFTSFYTEVGALKTSVERDKAAPLFGEMIEIPNLESLILSLLNIHKIWSDQHLSSFCFENLIKLVVKDCDKLTYLCSLSMASQLKKLKSLVISECWNMEKIFETERNSANKVCIFPKLEEIHLSKMNRLTNIWETEVSVDSFSSIISVHIEECNKLDKIFPSYMEGWFESLEKLNVIKCKSVEMIFEIKDSQEIDASTGIDTNLQLIYAYKLPSLKQVWSKDPEGILDFKNLRSIKVYSCDELSNLFPASVAEDVQKLENMMVLYCEKMEEIVACEDESEGSNEALVFPELTCMELTCLSNMKSFYKGRHQIKCPKLKKLTIHWCGELTIFSKETRKITNEEEKYVLSTEKVFPNLEYLEIDFKEAHKLLSFKYLIMHRLKQLVLKSVYNHHLLFQFLNRMPNLEKLKLDFCRQLRKLVPKANIAAQERLGTVLHLKELFLEWSWMKDIGFERDQVLQRLELLRLDRCDKLSNLAPPSVSFTYLTYLEVKYCDGLRNLMASSTAKTMLQLKTMKVIGCDKVEQIVTNDEGSEEKIVFSKLSTIELVGLKKLESFCSYENCEFEFPSLEVLIVRECGKMETFSEGPSEAPKLENIFIVEGEEKAKWQWEGELNATIQKAFSDELIAFTYSQNLWLDYDNKLIVQQLWHGSHSVHQNSFRYLKTLKVYHCHTLVNVIPSHLLSCFENLEELTVWACREAQVIFNISDDIRKTKGSGIIRLKTLYLGILPNLEHVWDKDPEGIMGFPVLQKMHLYTCIRLKSVFPASVAKDLTRLEELKIKECEKLEEIVWKDEETAEREGRTLEFVFSRLSSLKLQKLPRLKYCMKESEEEGEFLESAGSICLGSCLLMLSSLTLDGCHFSSDLLLPFNLLPFLKYLKTLEVRNSDSVKTIFDVKCTAQDTEITSMGPTLLFPLKNLTLSNLSNLENVWNADPHGILSMHHLQEVHVEKCKCLTSVFPTSVVKDAVKLKEVVVKNCEGLMTIIAEGNADGSGTDQELTFLSPSPSTWSLEVEGLPNFKYFYSSSKQCDNLESLTENRVYVEEISEFMQHKIWHGSLQIPDLCFSKLATLFVDNCQFLSDVVLPFHLLPLLPNLETLKVQNCDSIKTIFDVKCTAQDTEITSMGPTLLFPLKNLTLSNLSNLENVWNADPHGIVCMKHLQRVEVEDCKCLTSVFPTSVVKDVENLDKLVVKDCEGLMTIVAEDNTDPSRTNVELTCPCVRSLELEGLPNFRYFEKPTSNMQCLLLGQNGVEMISRGELQRSLLHSIKVLILYRVELDVFPYEILQEVPNIEKLVVYDGSFKEIFCSNVDCSGLVLQLKVLHLESLGELVSIGLNLVAFNLTYLKVQKCNNLRYLFTSNLVASNLTYLKVEECNNLRYLLTSSTAKSLTQLKRMEIIWCYSIEEIVSKEGEESDEDEIIFPQLTCLKLERLRNLRSFYEGSLSLPSLEELSITDYNEMVTLCSGTIKAEKLSQVKVDLEEVILLDSDVNSTMRKKFLRKAASDYYLQFKDRADLQEIWRVSLDIPHFCFYYLKTLIVDGCKLLSHVLPFTLLPLLPKIETLEVRNCDSVKTIFDVKCTTQDTSINFPLKKLVLSNLPNLKNVWNEDPHGIVCMNDLQAINVENCKCLTSVFPASVAKDLVQLQNLAVKRCEGLKAIVGEDNFADPKGTNEDEEIIFERLRVLYLEELDELRCFYPGKFTLRFPSLEKVYVIKCGSMKSFSEVNKIDGSTKWYSAEDATPREETDLNSAVVRKFGEEMLLMPSLSSSSSDSGEDEQHMVKIKSSFYHDGRI